MIYYIFRHVELKFDFFIMLLECTGGNPISKIASSLVLST